jgi:hypothetical protein
MVASCGALMSAVVSNIAWRKVSLHSFDMILEIVNGENVSHMTKICCRALRITSQAKVLPGCWAGGEVENSCNSRGIWLERSTGCNWMSLD